MANRLANETSPYLLQHKDNPVDWFPWGEEALARARDEERPDLDSIYMEACQAMTGQGGWPLNVFLTPGQVPFFAGTYFPPESRMGMPSWRSVLEAVAQAWQDRRDEIEAGGARGGGGRRGGAPPQAARAEPHPPGP